MSGELIKRTLTGCVLATATVAAVYSGSFYVAALFWVVMNIGLHEWSFLSARMKVELPLFWLYAWGNLLYFFMLRKIWGAGYWPDLPVSECLMAACALCLLGLLLYTVFCKEKGGVKQFAMVLTGGFYVSGSLAMLNALAVPSSAWEGDLLMGFFLVIWAGDVFAYVVGSLLGKHKLCPWLSPSKTWEGAIGGLALALLTGFIWGWLRLTDMNLGLWMGMSAVIALAGMLGDFTESKLKREAGVKDSGTLLPGHGGILDRFDSVLLAAPLAVGFLFVVSLF